jgi:outer membrane protein, multidrug efflux system
MKSPLLSSVFLRGLPGLPLLASLLTLFGGCAVGPDYRRPESTAPATFVNTAGLAVTNAPAAHRAWWRSFNDPVLDELIARASTNNYDLRRAEARLREARALWTEARFDFAPTVRNENRYEKSQLSRDAAGSRGRRSELYRVGFDATWELDLWGAVRRNVEAARATVESVEATLDDTVIAVEAEVALNYFELRGTQAQLDVATRNATNQSQTLNLAIALRDGGQGTQLDVARARSLLNATLASIPPLETDRERAIHRLSILCGLPPVALRPQLLERVKLPAAPPVLELTEPGEWIRRRPDIRAAERALAASTALIGVEVADLFPRVTFNGSVGLQASSFSGLTSSGADSYSFGPRISWAAFDLGRVRQRIKASDARAQQALAEYEQTVLLALEEAENSLVALGRERQRAAFLAEAERAGAEAVELARQRYRDGISDYLSVLDAERTLLDLQEQLVTAQTLSATRLIAVFKSFAVR